LFDKLMVCLDCRNALPCGQTWSCPTVAFVLAFTLGPWGVFWVFKFIFVTYPMSMLYAAKKFVLCYIGRYVIFSDILNHLINMTYN